MSAEPHAYTVPFRAGRYVLAAGLALVGLYLFTIRPGGVANPVLPALLLLAAGAYAVLSTARTRLTLSAQGLEYRNAGETIRARWDQVLRISRRHGRYGARIVLVVATSRREISLSQFGGDWRTSGLGQDLEHYAPRLFRENPALR